jgi:hypothetical protein
VIVLPEFPLRSRAGLVVSAADIIRGTSPPQRVDA